MYNPPAYGAYDGQELEFLELRNVGDGDFDLSGASFSDGVTLTFAEGTVLSVGGYGVVASNAAAFAERYPNVSLLGEYEGQLANGGERLELVDASGESLLVLDYDDVSPWPVSADGLGYSLVLRDESAWAGAASDAALWRASVAEGGSPGEGDPELEVAEILINEVLAHTDLPAVDAVELYNPSDEAVDVSGWYLTDDRAEPMKCELPEGSVIPAGGYLTVTEAVFASEELGENAFRLDSHGDEIWLYSGDGDGVLTGYRHGFAFGDSDNGVSFGRMLDSTGREWLAFLEAVSLGRENGDPLVGEVVISEIMYDPVSGGVEFVEIVNRGEGAVALYDVANPLNTWKLDGVGYHFPIGISLAVGEVAIVASVEPEVARAELGLAADAQVFGPFEGSLSNEGEEVALRYPDDPDVLESGETYVPYIDLDRVAYLPEAPWPEVADGTGRSIERVELGGWGLEPTHWRASVSPTGSPGVAGVLSFGDWQKARFSELELLEVEAVSFEGDFDGDGRSNGWEYALGLDPRVAEEGDGLVWLEAEGALEISLVRDLRAGEAELFAEWSGGLVDWVAVDVEWLTVQNDWESGVQECVWRWPYAEKGTGYFRVGCRLVVEVVSGE